MKFKKIGKTKDNISKYLPVGKTIKKSKKAFIFHYHQNSGCNLLGGKKLLIAESCKDHLKCWQYFTF